LTLAGYNETQKNVSHLVVLARFEDAVATAVVGFHGFLIRQDTPEQHNFATA
jgi:hypothetical protein